MKELSISLSLLADGPKKIEVVAPASVLRPAEASDLPTGPVSIKGILSEAGNQYLFQGQVSCTFRHICDRCLGPAEQVYDATVAWVFMQGHEPMPEAESEDLDEDQWDEVEPEEDDGGFFWFEGDTIDLRARVWEEIVLAAPVKYLCSEDCAGLCPLCGVNMNHTQCACQQTEDIKNTGLAGLGDLFPDLGPQRSED